MKITTKRFGEIDVNEIWTFETGLPGFETNHQFTLLEPEDSYPVAWLQSTEEPETCLSVIFSFKALPEYVFDIDEVIESELNLNDPEKLVVLTVLSIPDDITKMTANLAAPVLVNLDNNKGKQIVITGADYPVKYPIFEDMCKQLASEVQQ